MPLIQMEGITIKMDTRFRGGMTPHQKGMADIHYRIPNDPEPYKLHFKFPTILVSIRKQNVLSSSTTITITLRTTPTGTFMDKSTEQEH